VVIKVKNSSKIESILSTILYYLLYKYISLILFKSLYFLSLNDKFELKIYKQVAYKGVVYK